MVLWLSSILFIIGGFTLVTHTVHYWWWNCFNHTVHYWWWHYLIQTVHYWWWYYFNQTVHYNISSGGMWYVWYKYNINYCNYKNSMCNFQLKWQWGKTSTCEYFRTHLMIQNIHFCSMYLMFMSFKSINTSENYRTIRYSWCTPWRITWNKVLTVKNSDYKSTLLNLKVSYFAFLRPPHLHGLFLLCYIELDVYPNHLYHTWSNTFHFIQYKYHYTLTTCILLLY